MKEYRKPVLKVWGDVANLTRQVALGDGEDDPAGIRLSAFIKIKKIG